MNRRNNVSGAARTGLLVLILTVVIAGGLVALLHWQGHHNRLVTTGQALVMYCAAGIKPPVATVAEEYEKQYGVPIRLQYGGSGTLLSNLRIAQSGDLYLCADDSYVKLGREQGLLAEVIPLAHQRPVIAVRQGNPKHIQTLADLLGPDVRVALANPEAAAVGKVTQKRLTGAGQWEALAAHVQQSGVFKPTVSDVANDVKIGSVDAGIIWDSTARQYPELEIVAVPLFEQAVQQISVTVLTFSKQPTAALRFARYLGARDRGLKEFTRNHYEPVDGDEWAETPEVVLYSGAMLRPGIEQTLKDFEQREGCQITTVYNGCGILCAQMRAGERPDAYFSCDTSFMSSVADLYLQPATLVDNNLMILVQKGNPKGIHSLQDLTKPGIRLGLPHHEKSAMGNIAWKMLKKMGLYDTLLKNMQVESPTGDFLVNQLRTGSLDAIIACRTNYRPVRQYIDAIPIDSPQSAMAEPYAVGRNTKYHYLMTRLFNTLVTADSQKRFKDVGFGWRYQTSAKP